MKEIRICLVGDINTGKSTFTNSLKNNNLMTCRCPTIGVEYTTYYNNDIVWKIWDTSGNDNHTSIILPYFKLANLFILFFDINEIKSFLSLENWIKDIKHANANDLKNINFILVGNKSDLIKSINQIDINTLCNEYNIDYIEISIKKYSNIDKLHNKINSYLKKELNNIDVNENVHSDYEKLIEDDKDHKKCCSCNIL